VVDAGRNDFDAIALGAIQRDELIAFLVGGSDHQVGAVDDLALDPGPRRRVVTHPRVGLDAIERVEGRHEWQVELVLEAVPDGAGDPVVHVQHVVGGFPLGDEGERRLGEWVDEIQERMLRDRCGRPGADVDDPEPALDLDDGRLLGVLGPRQHVAQDARPGEVRTQRAHIHVHAPAVARARLCERGGVHAEHGDAADGHRDEPTCGR
jgi:hypothetical protein